MESRVVTSTIAQGSPLYVVLGGVTLPQLSFIMRTLIVPLLITGLLSQQANAEIDFNRDIRPILSDKCFACHGRDAENREADLRLDTYEGATAELDGVKALDPAHLEDSEILFRIESDDKKEVMPPPKTNKPLGKAEIALLKEWVMSGGKYDAHWAFTPVTDSKPPAVKNASWVRNRIDQYVLARLQAAKLVPAAAASKSALIRRTTLDITGLPPTLAEVKTFLDDKSPDAFEKLIDRLLSSPRYGEHMARYWLDAVRYGDTHGLHLDNYREFYPYRDWVIAAFNANKSWADFVTEQLAGDLMPSPTNAQLVATGFNRAHVTTSEGGSIKEEVYVRNVKDRIDTFGTLFLGLTVTCAGCHDHKFDPLSQKDYYSLFAYFNSLDANPMDGNKKDHAPVVRVETPDQKQRIAKLREQIASTRSKINQAVAAFTYTEPAKPSGRVPPKPQVITWIDDSTPAGAKLTGPWKFEAGPIAAFSGKTSHAQTAKGNQQHFFENAKTPLVVGPGDLLFAYAWIDPRNPPKELMLQFNDGGSWEHRAYWGGNHINWGKAKTPSRVYRGALPTVGKWTRLEVKAADVGLNPGNKISGWAFTQFDGTVRWDKAGIVSMKGQNHQFDSLRQWISFQRSLEQPTVPDEIAAIIRKEGDTLSADERRRATNHFVEHAYSKTRTKFAALHQEIAEAERQIADSGKSFATTLIWKEKAQPKASFMLNRGEYDQKGDQVSRALPAFLPPLPKGASNDRLGLAQWLLDEQHPLFARVTVNRFWQQLFGTGLVKTAEDFGMQGDPPSHPELLDWLAIQYRASGWDTKELMKLMLSSATYRQAANFTPEKLRSDPENRLLAHGPRFRLDAETLRDQALAVSGLLVERIGGPGVKPPQPAGLWKSVGYSGSNTVRFKADTGHEKVHRRSIYTFWKRTAPPPQMSIIDAPPRESCVVRRERTNTPLQALLLMNDPQYFEAARHLGQRAIAEGGPTPRARIAWMFEVAVSRSPTTDELEIVYHYYLEQAKEFAMFPDRARQAITVGAMPVPGGVNDAELATWTMVSNLVMNLDEFLTK